MTHANTHSPKADPTGVLVIDKPKGMTSHDVVGITRKLFQTKRVGHTGTLDPDATGVLVLCLGNATRLAEYLSAARKHYVALVQFGIETDTLDGSGTVLRQSDASALTEASVHELLPHFRGNILQIPPMVSARHHEGQRLYELARKGIVVEREAREVTIDELEMIRFSPGNSATVELSVTCSTGTYIRTLAADIGAAAGSGAAMMELRRTWVGGSEAESFHLREAHTIEDLRARAEVGTLRETLLPLTTALRGWNLLRLPESTQRRLLHGQAVPLRELSPAEAARLTDTNPMALVGETDTLLAVLRVREGLIQPVKVFASHETA